MVTFYITHHIFKIIPPREQALETSAQSLYLHWMNEICVEILGSSPYVPSIFRKTGSRDCGHISTRWMDNMVKCRVIYHIHGLYFGEQAPQATVQGPSLHGMNGGYANVLQVSPYLQTVLRRTDSRCPSQEIRFPENHPTIGWDTWYLAISTLHTSENKFQTSAPGAGCRDVSSWCNWKTCSRIGFVSILLTNFDKRNERFGVLRQLRFPLSLGCKRKYAIVVHILLQFFVLIPAISTETGILQALLENIPSMA